MRLKRVKTSFPSIKDEDCIIALVGDNVDSNDPKTYPEGGHRYFLKRSGGWNAEKGCTDFHGTPFTMREYMSGEFTVESLKEKGIELLPAGFDEVKFIQKDANGIHFGITNEQLIDMLLHRAACLQAAYPDDKDRYNRLVSGFNMVREAMIERVNARMKAGVMGELKETPKDYGYKRNPTPVERLRMGHIYYAYIYDRVIYGFLHAIDSNGICEIEHIGTRLDKNEYLIPKECLWNSEQSLKAYLSTLGK